MVNCTDGVDGLSASLAVVSMGTFALLYADQLASYVTATAVFVGALLAYLWVNAKPSTVLMGDAGSRAMGFFLALLALKSAHPFAFLLAAAVFIVDGSLGIVKISLKRFLHISVLKNTLTPLHDHARPPPRPRPQAAGLERRAGGPPLGHPAGRRLGGPGRCGRAGDVNLSRRASVFAGALACRVCATL